MCEVGWWIYVSIDRRPLPGRSGEDREGQHLTRISDGEWAPPEKQILTNSYKKQMPRIVFHIVDICGQTKAEL